MFQRCTISLAHEIQPAVDKNPDVLLTWPRLSTAVYEEYLFSSLGVRKPYVEVASVHRDGTLGGPMAYVAHQQRPAL